MPEMPNINLCIFFWVRFFTETLLLVTAWWTKMKWSRFLTLECLVNSSNTLYLLPIHRFLSSGQRPRHSPLVSACMHLLYVYSCGYYAPVVGWWWLIMSLTYASEVFKLFLIC